jgi:APA family basic amino acid/polyamine antiporter
MQLKDLFVTRDVAALLEETHSQGEELKKSIGAFGLTALGVGAIIGTGIFVVIGKGAAVAGPALVISFILAAVTCAFSAPSPMRNCRQVCPSQVAPIPPTPRR